MTQIGFGIDVSHWQNPDTLSWETFRGKVDFVIARACYGAKPDDRCVEHIRRARAIGAKVGVYVFFRPSESVEAQHKALVSVMLAAGIGPGDIRPAIDIEADTYPALQAVTPAWSAPTQALAESLTPLWGKPIVYQTHREWIEMGSPAWTLECPLWVAHYVDHAPATPGNMPATIHQHRVGPFDPSGPGGSFATGNPQLDQNRLLLPLPLIVAQDLTDEDVARIKGSVALTTEQSADEALHPEEFPLRDTEPSGVA
jgi:hypothetical protein